jgi:transketolase
LKNLSVLVDVNGLQGFGTTREVASMDELGARVEAFGIEAYHVDGHDVRAVAAAATAHPGAVILLHTVKGKGVSFMENRLEWHYLPLNDAQYAAALAELDRP